MFSTSLDLNALDLEALKALLIDRYESYTATLNSRPGEIERLVLLVEKLQLEELQAANAIEELKAVAPAERPHRPSPFAVLCLSIFRAKSIPNEVCPDCGGRLCELGEDVAEMLEYVRASFKVLRHLRPKLSCDACDRIVQAPAPLRPIDRGLAGPDL